MTRLVLLITLAVGASGCDAIGFIFKAGMFTGVLAVVAIVLLVVFLMNKVRR